MPGRYFESEGPATTLQRVKHPEPDAVDRAVERWQADGLPGDTTAVALFTRLGLVARAVAAHKERTIAALGVPMHVVETLYALRRRGRPYEAGPTDLARETGVSQAAMTARVRGLVADGLVTTRPDRDDGRRTLVRLTSRGHRLTERVFRLQQGVEERLLAALDETSRDDLDRALRTLVGMTAGLDEPGASSGAG